MTETDSLALQAIRLYSGGLTYGEVSKELKISKGRVADLVREGISTIINNESPGEGTTVQPGNEPKNPPTPNLNLEIDPAQTKKLLNFLQNPRPESFFLETTGIPKRILLTPKCLMIYDLWCGGGFTGDLSDFLEDAVSFLYEARRPAERG